MNVEKRPFSPKNLLYTEGHGQLFRVLLCAAGYKNGHKPPLTRQQIQARRFNTMLGRRPRSDNFERTLLRSGNFEPVEVLCRQFFR